MSKLKLKDLITEKTTRYKEKDWKKYNQLVKRGKVVAFQTDRGREYSWSEDSDADGVWGIDQDGNDHDFTHDDIDTIMVF